MTMTLLDRVEYKVLVGDGCWEWAGAHLFRPSGMRSYGSLLWRGRQTGAHRVAWELTNGLIPDGLYVLHHCDNQGCVRPDHLYLGTHADNTRDAVERRRMSHGTGMWNHKLTDDDVRRIREVAATGLATERIGPMFGVSGRTVRFIMAGKRWSHVN